MASRALVTITLLISLNLLFSTLVSSSHHKNKPCPPPPPPACPPPPKSPPKATCPRDVLKLGVCVDLLKGLLGLVVGTPPKEPCCSLIEGLADLEAAVCLCTTIKARLLGIKLDLPIALSLLLNDCDKSVPSGFKCA